MRSEPSLTLKTAFLGPTGNDSRMAFVLVELKGRILPHGENGWPLEITTVIEGNTRFTASLMMWPSLTPGAARVMAQHLMQNWMGVLCGEVKEWNSQMIDYCRESPEKGLSLYLTPDNLTW